MVQGQVDHGQTSQPHQHCCTQRTQTGSHRRGPRGGTKGSERLRLLSLNVGSLSTLLWQELKEFLLTAPHDIICLQETHWSTSSEFIVQGWRAVHSGSKARADGVLTLFHPRHKADTIRHEEIQQGRVLRTQLVGLRSLIATNFHTTSQSTRMSCGISARPFSANWVVLLPVSHFVPH